MWYKPLLKKTSFAGFGPPKITEKKPSSQPSQNRIASATLHLFRRGSLPPAGSNCTVSGRWPPRSGPGAGSGTRRGSGAGRSRGPVQRSRGRNAGCSNPTAKLAGFIWVCLKMWLVPHCTQWFC